MSTSETRPFLDHIVILVPHTALTSPPAWLTDAFTFSPGGRHADGLTENVLILFESGSYIEMIAFVEGVSDERRRQHRWGRAPEGSVVDWAYSLPSEADFGPIRRRVNDAGAGVEYGELIPGGRTRADGVRLDWAISSPSTTDVGLLPFWCLDHTARCLRVPVTEENTRHCCAAEGVASVQVRVASGEKVEQLASVFNAIHGESPRTPRLTWPFTSPLAKARGGRVEVVFPPAAPSGLAQDAIALELFTTEGAPRIISGRLGNRSVSIRLVPR